MRLHCSPTPHEAEWMHLEGTKRPANCREGEGSEEGEQADRNGCGGKGSNMIA